MTSFTFSSVPHVIFGPRSIRKLGAACARFGGSVLLIVGGSLSRSGKLNEVTQTLTESGITYAVLSVSGEPSPDVVDSAVAEFAKRPIDAVAAVGGGSVLDFGKAVSAMLIVGRPGGVSVTEFLEGVGTRVHDGSKVPFIAVPTTSGTGSEATKNAVLSRVGRDGFKKSIRHDNFVPNVAIVDPERSLTCPAEVTAACGMDALTQLLESYFSTKANPMTDSLAIGAIGAVGRGLVTAALRSPDDVNARSEMAYAAFVSGLTLANAGLGLVHGVAAVVGGEFPVPHGVVCANVMAPAMKRTLDALRTGAADGDAKSAAAVGRFAWAGALLSGADPAAGVDRERHAKLLVDTLYEWTELFSIPRLGRYGITSQDVGRLAAASENKNNPAAIPRDGIEAILRERL